MEDFELTKKPDIGIFNRRFPAMFDDPIYDPTKMTIIQGTDGQLDDLFSYQVYNKLKNHWRLDVEPADKQVGMIWSESGDNDKLFHYGEVGGEAWEEILQVTRSNDKSPQFATVRLMDTGGDHYLDLKCNEDLGAHRLLNIIVGDAARTITLSGSPTLGNWFDQSVKQASSPTFNSPSLTTCAISGKLTIGAAIGTASSMLDVRDDTTGAWIASFEQDHATGWGVLIEVDSVDTGDPAFSIYNNAGRILNVSAAGNLKLDIGNITLDSATSTITGGVLLYIEAGAIYSHTIADDTTVSLENVYIDSVTGHLYRSTSGGKYKNKIKDMELDSSKLYQLRPVSFNSLCKGDDKDKRFHGLNADEVEKIYPEIVVYGANNEVENYDHRMIMTLILAETQRHEKRIKALETQLNN